MVLNHRRGVFQRIDNHPDSFGIASLRPCVILKITGLLLNTK